MAEQKYVLCREFTVTVVSAQNLPNVHRVSKPKVYAKVSLGSDRKTEQRTRADKHGKLNPTWNKKMEYTIEDSDVMHYGLQLVIEFYFKRKFARDLYIGENHWSIKDLFNEAYEYNRGGSAQLYLPIKNGLSETGGTMCFQYRFGKRIWVKKELCYTNVMDNKHTHMGGWHYLIQVLDPRILSQVVIHYGHLALLFCKRVLDAGASFLGRVVGAAVVGGLGCF